MDDKRALTLTAAEVEKLTADDAAKVLAAHVKAKKTELIEALAQSANKALARAAKKAAYQLKSSGVQVEAKKAEPPPAPKAPEKKEEWPALFTVVAGTGELGMYVVRPQRGGGLAAWRAVTQDELGLVRLERLTFSRASYRKSVKQIIGDGMAYEVPFERAKEELGRALALNEASKSPLPQGAAEAMMQLEIEPNHEPLKVEAPTAEDERLAARGGELHAEHELQNWFPSPDTLKVLDQRMQETLNSPLALSEAQKVEQLHQKAVQTAKEYFTEAVRRVYAGRLIKMADFFAVRGREEARKLCLATARVLFHQPGPGPYGEKMFTQVIDQSLAAQAKAVGQMTAQAEAAQANAPRLSPPGAKRSPGGLVLP